MKKLLPGLHLIFALFILVSCRQRATVPSESSIDSIYLKTGAIVSCGPADKLFGAVSFETSCSEKVKKDFDLAISILHSFEYDEAEKVFAKIIKDEPGCAMAYWGVAMCNYHPLWSPPTQPELVKGAKAIAVAKSISKKTQREADYIEAIELYYKDSEKLDHRTRAISFEKAMEKLHTTYPNDKESAIFYALALDAAAAPTDKTFANQKKAYSILTSLYPGQPEHPGIVHYIIHSYDYPGLASQALTAARKYASIAPSSAHAQHMPSHIFTRLGLWDECIQSNLTAAESAKCYAENAGIKGHWDEEMHALDYLMYGYLQKGDNEQAKKLWDYLKTINDVAPFNFKVAYAFAAMPARYVLENKLWKEAASLEVHNKKFDWEQHHWQRAIVHFARAMGAAHLGNIDSARAELKSLSIIHDELTRQKDAYKADHVLVQAKTAEAWILLKEVKNSDAIRLMTEAADMEDKTEKHPVSPGEVLPARELLGDMLLQINQPDKALDAYEANLKKHPNRFNGLYGAAVAAQKCNKPDMARARYEQLLSISQPTNSKRAELEVARGFIETKK
ncbi:MAG: hypothetical protein V4722_06155 [Bacteroidota bacterium]